MNRAELIQVREQAMGVLQGVSREIEEYELRYGRPHKFYDGKKGHDKDRGIRLKYKQLLSQKDRLQVIVAQLSVGIAMRETDQVD